MESDIFEILPALLIDGMWIGLAVMLTVQVLKIMEIITSTLWLKRSPIIVALVLGLFWLIAEMAPVTEPYIAGVFRAYVGSLTAALAYPYVLKPLLEKLGIPVSRASLNDN